MSRGFKIVLGAVLAVALVLVFVAWRAGAFDSANDYRRSERPTPRPVADAQPPVVAEPAIVTDAPPPAPGEVHVTALELVKDYKADDISADDKYRNRTLHVTGVAAKVGRDAFDYADEPNMALLTTKSGDVIVHLVGAVKLLKNGKQATLCSGGGFLMEMPSLDGCAVE
jgi:hypothetical protein